MIGLQTRDNEAPRCPPGVDELLGRQARPRPKVSQVKFHGARPNADELGGLLNGSTRRDERCEDSRWAEGALLRELFGVERNVSRRASAARAG